MKRRQFVRTGAFATFALGAAPTIVPRHVLGGLGFVPPSERLNIGVIGAGGMGASNAAAVTSEHLAAFADVDFGYVDKGMASRVRDDSGKVRPAFEALKKAYDQAPHYTDFREMLDRESGLDAVIVATPDHMHAIAALAAMQKRKHVYVQKPLTYTVEEARALARAAEITGVVTQMGNQGHSGDDGRRAVEVLRSGILGPIREVYGWTNRPVNWWMQGVPKGEPKPVPPGLHWDLYLGPAADRPYYEGIHPFGWRGWVDFGVASLGDMGAHLLDFPVWGLELDRPTRVETRHTPWGGPPRNPDTYPYATIVSYEFERQGTPLSLTWYDGGLLPPTPHRLPADYKLSTDGGIMYVGENGILIHDTYGLNPKFFPDTLDRAARDVPRSLPRIAGGINGHEQNWVRAIKGEEAISCPFSYAAPLTETMLLGIAALWAEQALRYDAAAMRFPDAPGADRYLRRTYREGWALPQVS